MKKMIVASKGYCDTEFPDSKRATESCTSKIDACLVEAYKYASRLRSMTGGPLQEDVIALQKALEAASVKLYQVERFDTDNERYMAERYGL